MVQLLYLLMPIREGVGTETPDGSVSVEGDSLDSPRICHQQNVRYDSLCTDVTKEQLKSPKPAIYGLR